MSPHQVASAVNRLVIAKGIISREAGQQSYTRLRHILREGNLHTVEQLWEVVQARIARADARKQAVKDARKAAEAPMQRSLLGNFDPADDEGDADWSSLPCSGLAECFCDDCEQRRAEEAQDSIA